VRRLEQDTPVRGIEADVPIPGTPTHRARPGRVDLVDLPLQAHQSIRQGRGERRHDITSQDQVRTRQGTATTRTSPHTGPSPTPRHESTTHPPATSTPHPCAAYTGTRASTPYAPAHLATVEPATSESRDGSAQSSSRQDP